MIMNVLVDTCVWSRLFRKGGDENDPIVLELKALINEYRAQIIGPIRQEILSGIKNQKQFNLLRDHLRAFTDINITTQDYETAAEMSNHCRRKGVQGSHTDFLICAIAKNHGFAIFTVDRDFEYYQRNIQVDLLKSRNRV
jgi:predicted nucleic acid-binding protein